MFSSLKHPLRRKVLRILATGPKTFTEVLQQVDVDSAHFSYHLESLGGLIRKGEDGKYRLSELGRAASSLMARVEEPPRLVTPAIIGTPRRLKVAQFSFLILLILGAAFLVNGVLALPSTNYKQMYVQQNVDTDLWTFPPSNVSGFSSFYYRGDGIYGVEVDLNFRDAFTSFPLVVRLSTPIGGNETAQAIWDESWYEWVPLAYPSQPDIHERFSVTLSTSGDTASIISQTSWNQVHPSPGKIIGGFRPTNALLLVKVAPEIGNRNVTLAGFRAFQVKSFYFPNSESATKNIQLISGLSLAIPSIAFLLSSRTVWHRRQNEQ
jgi:DNA-binding transcriptional ArsR family regulator